MTTENENTAPFDAILAAAQSRWHSLTAGAAPWIRIGTGLAGEAAGGFEVVSAVNDYTLCANMHYCISNEYVKE